MPEWLIIVGQTAIVAVLAFLVFSAVTSHLRFQAMTRRARDAKSPAPGAQPAFELRIARQLGTAHRNPEPFTIARIAPAALPQLRELHGAGVVRDIFEKIEEHLKKSLRADDTTLRVNEDEVDVLIRSRRVAGESAVRRALHSLSSTPIKFSSGLSVRVDAIAGMASYPEDGDRAPDLYAKAGAALDAARSAGQGLHWPEGSAAAAPAEQRAEEGDAANVLDELTGVLRHDRIGTALQKFIAARRRDDLPVSVLLLDIDSLRRYNKQYGEKTGDALLRGLAQFLQTNTRESDLIARWAEDQFLVALHCAPNEALSVAQRLSSDVRKASFGRDGLRLTITVGISGWPGHSGNARGLFEEAQLALRVGKNKGRNQCILFDEEMRKLNVAAAPTESF